MDFLVLQTSNYRQTIISLSVITKMKINIEAKIAFESEQ